MNNEELKRKAAEFIDSMRERIQRAELDHCEVMEEAFLAGHQLAIEGVAGSECDSFHAWCSRYFGHGMPPSQSYYESTMSAYQDAWQARGLLAAKRERELVAEIELLQKVQQLSERRINRLIKAMGSSQECCACPILETALEADEALAADDKLTKDTP